MKSACALPPGGLAQHRGPPSTAGAACTDEVPLLLPVLMHPMWAGGCWGRWHQCHLPAPRGPCLDTGPATTSLRLQLWWWLQNVRGASLPGVGANTACTGVVTGHGQGPATDPRAAGFIFEHSRAPATLCCSSQCFPLLSPILAAAGRAAPGLLLTSASTQHLRSPKKPSWG